MVGFELGCVLWVNPKTDPGLLWISKSKGMPNSKNDLLPWQLKHFQAKEKKTRNTIFAVTRKARVKGIRQ